FFREWGLIIGIALIIAVATVIRPAFLSGNNILNILRAYSTIGIASIGMTYVIIGGGMDLSVGSTISLSSVIVMLFINATVVDGVSPVYAALLVLLIGTLVGAAVGAVNGCIMAAVNGRMGESFIITYAMQIVIAAAAQAVVKGTFQAAKYSGGLFKDLGIGLVPVLIFAAVAALMQLILMKTKFGRNLFFLGANMDAAKMAGIKIKSTRIMAHVICGACAGLAGVLIVSRVNSASSLQGVGYELDAMASVAVGGTSLAGGNGSVTKTVLGVLVIGVMLTALNVLGVNSNAQLIVRGIVIILSVILDAWNKRSKLKEVAK
ncbi:MAG TPA: ABC transporter permease, partial [Feifaniaceae bacterium]|nr:ABC transporter permease [Feifaniaceae bacterium]